MTKVHLLPTATITFARGDDPLQQFPVLIEFPDGRVSPCNPFTQKNDFSLLKPHEGTYIRLTYEYQDGIDRIGFLREVIQHDRWENGHDLAIVEKDAWLAYLEDLKDHEVYVDSLYRNLKNKTIYRVTGTGLHSETMEEMVAYENVEGKAYYRPKWLFIEKFEFVEMIHRD